MTTNQDQPNHITLERFKPLQLITNTPKGRGVIAVNHIPSGTIIDVCPVLVLSPEENKAHIEHTSLYHYTYNWPCPGVRNVTQAVVFGLGSMFNHSRNAQNVGWQRDVQREVVLYRALRDIQVGEELCISYGDRLTFEDADGVERVDGETDDERLEHVLGEIEVDAA